MVSPGIAGELIAILSQYSGEDDYDDVVQEVSGLAAEFYSFGGALGLSPSKLDTIRYDGQLNATGKLEAVVKKFLAQDYNTKKRGLPTWKKIVQAAERSNRALARIIADNHPGIY